MPDLTKEEREKIYAEEKARGEAKEKIEKEAKAKKNKSSLIGCLGFLALLILFMAICGVFDSNDTPSESKPEYVTIRLDARFDGSQFILSNLNNFNWSNVELEINGGLLKSGYKLKHRLMEAGETYTVGALQFVKPDGTRLNPYTIKPQNITVFCDTPSGRGYISLDW